MKQPIKPVLTRRSELISKRKMQESADCWFDFFQEAFLQMVVGEVKFSREQLKERSEKAREIADIGLEEFEERWPGL